MSVVGRCEYSVSWLLLLVGCLLTEVVVVVVGMQLRIVEMVAADSGVTGLGGWGGFVVFFALQYVWEAAFLTYGMEWKISTFFKIKSFIFILFTSRSPTIESIDQHIFTSTT